VKPHGLRSILLNKDSDSTSGAPGGNPPADDTKETEKEKEEDKPEKPTFDAAQQKYINDVLLKGVREEGRTQGQKNLLKELGVEDVEAAKKAVADKKAAEDAEKTEVQRLTDRLDAIEKASKTEVAAVTTALVKTEIRALALEAGLDAEALTGLLESLGSLDRFTYDAEAGKVVGLADAVDKLKTLVGERQTKGGKPWPQQTKSEPKTGGKESTSKQALATFKARHYPKQAAAKES
jgi:hypothetical protein